MGIPSLKTEQLAKLTEVAHYVSELANLRFSSWRPYVGPSAFAHKGGLHASGQSKWEQSYQHIDPVLVGNKSGVLISELSGVASVISKAKELGLDLTVETESARRILDEVKFLENQGFQYDVAEASFELLVRRNLPGYKPPFELVDFLVVVERRRRPPTDGQEIMSEATVKVKVGDRIIHTAAEGDGPVNALDRAMRKALISFYPDLAVIRLMDYKVRILEETAGTESQVRVLIESTDGEYEWRTVGGSTDIIEASWLALADSLEYWLLSKSSTTG
jgi:2-isopropylmalate synthase